MAQVHVHSEPVQQSYPLTLLIIFSGYYFAGVIGLAAPFTNNNVSPVWPPAGLALASMLIWGYRVWPAIFLGAFLVNAVTHVPLGPAIAIAIGNTMSPVVASFLLQRVPEFSITLSRVRDVLALILCGCVVGSLCAASIGSSSLYAVGIRPWSSYSTAWVVWLLGDAMGVLLIAPLLLTGRIRPAQPARWIEKIFLALITVLTTLLIFDDRVVGRATEDVLAFLVFPFVIWAAIRFGQAGVATTTAIVATTSVWETAMGHGPFVRHGALLDIGFLQLFLAVIAISGYLLAAAVLERKHAEAALAREQELLRQREAAEQALIRGEKLAATGRIAATIAHEINNPLAAISNLAYLLQQEELPPEAKVHVATLAKEVKRISHIARQTLGFYRQSSSPTQTAVSEVFDDLLDVYHKRIDEKSIVVEKRYSSRGIVEAYRGELQQVLANLFLNACDAVAMDGKVSIAVEDLTGSQVRIVVADNGPGITEANRSRIFEPFFSTKAEKGVGLGLWVSQGIIHKHGGEIMFRNGTHDGEPRTQFEIVLPRHFPASRP